MNESSREILENGLLLRERTFGVGEQESSRSRGSDASPSLAKLTRFRPGCHPVCPTCRFRAASRLRVPVAAGRDEAAREVIVRYLVDVPAVHRPNACRWALPAKSCRWLAARCRTFVDRLEGQGRLDAYIGRAVGECSRGSGRKGF
jgi:hypothetical protein